MSVRARAVSSLAARSGLILAVSLGLAFLLFLICYRSTRSGSSVLDFPRVLLYLAQTRSSSPPAMAHPLLPEALAAHPGSPPEYSSPLGRALDGLGRSLEAVAAALILILGQATAVFLLRAGLARRPRMGAEAVSLPLRLVEQLQRLPGLVIFFAVWIATAGGIAKVADGLPRALILAAILANSDGTVPDLAEQLRQRYEALRDRDYVKVGILEGRPLAALSRRELAMTVGDALGNRALQIVGAAFLLEVLLGYSGIGRLCLLNLFPSGGSGGGMSQLSLADELYAVLLLMVALSGTILLGRRIMQRILDPRPRTVVAR